MANSVDAALEPYLVDSAPTFVGVEYTAEPKNLDEAAAVLRVASMHRLPTLILGSGTHQGIGYPMENPQLALSTAKLNEVIDYQPEDLTLVIGAGATLGQLEDLLSERGQTAVLPEASRDATVGGVVAAGLSGWRRLGYGPIRDRILETEVVTGDGRIITAGGRVVKNVTGYDIPRLMTGSLGSLGLIGAVCFKLWPNPAHMATIPVADADVARSTAYRPLAIIETNDGAHVFVAGTQEEIAGQASDLGSEATPGLAFPDPLTTPFQFSLRVPASSMTAAMQQVAALDGAWQYQAAHGVGEIKLGTDDVDFAVLQGLRTWAEAAPGSLVVTTAPPGTYEAFDPWGTPPPTLELQRRVKETFDPVGIMNTGRLPGRL